MPGPVVYTEHKMYEFTCGYCHQEILMDHAWMLSFSKEEVHLDCKDPFGYMLNEPLDTPAEV